ncbi:MAG TPA: ABC transporter permease [Vicinamibacterales bacterium]|jgi:putative ABC transport system permease protein|nr:ABC transporter permease [Vicinamibacterales bacterium]
MKKLLTSARIALRALRVNRTRSALTMLGIIIGVAAVIAMVGVGAGATERIQAQIQSIGSNLIIVLPGSISSNGVRLGSGGVATLTTDDAKAIADECPSVAVTAPTVRGGAQVVYGSNNWATVVQGVTPDYMTLRDYTMMSGQFFTTQDVDASAKLAVLGETVTQNLFGDSDPTGQVVIIKNVPFIVSGVLTPKGQSPTGQDQDDVILLPISTATQKVLGVNKANAKAVGSVMVQATSPEAIDQAIQEMEALLRERHRILPGLEDDFSIRNLTEVFAAQESSAQVMAVLLGAIASVSLIVGGIGIMNIMLVSVTERTREIGLRLAVGAKRRDILSQFLVEAVTLSLAGGIIGILVGVTTSFSISYFAQWSTDIGVMAVAVSFLFSALVGVFFGYYPARTAAFLNPIEALRYE